MRRLRFAAATVLVACGVLGLVIGSAGSPAPASKTVTTCTRPPATCGIPPPATRSAAGPQRTVNPQGQSTTYYSRDGTTASYGLQTSPAHAGAGNGNVGVRATIDGLNADTTYHYQLVAQNAGGTSFGTDETLTTTSSPAAVLGREGFVAAGTA